MRSEIEQLINTIRAIRETMREDERQVVLAEIGAATEKARPTFAEALAEWQQLRRKVTLVLNSGASPAIRWYWAHSWRAMMLDRAVSSDDEAELLAMQEGCDACTIWAVIYMLQRLPQNPTEEDAHVQLRRLELSARVIAERILREEGVIGEPTDDDAE